MRLREELYHEIWEPEPKADNKAVGDRQDVGDIFEERAYGRRFSR